jgi:integrase
MADAEDLKSSGDFSSCGFDSHPGHHCFLLKLNEFHDRRPRCSRRVPRLSARIPNGHVHRFRDTFAVELLLAGVPIERVSVLLGHQSVRITERVYAPWVRSRQEQLEADLARA